MSTLYRTEALKNSHYNPTGEGRDTYIYVNNGGVERNKYPYTFFEESRVTRRSFSPGSPRLEPKPLKYKSDGTGRDTYIGSNHGGLFGNYEKHSFYSSLREPSPVTTKATFFSSQTAWLQRRRAQDASYQKQLSRRLSLPKESRTSTVKSNKS
jgi:hypothetical protein